VEHATRHGWRLCTSGPDHERQRPASCGVLPPALAETLVAGFSATTAVWSRKTTAGWPKVTRPRRHSSPRQRRPGSPCRRLGTAPAGSSLSWNLPRLDVVPFDARHQYMSTLHDAGAGRPRLIYLKGSVEAVLPRCSSALDVSGRATGLDEAAVHADVDDMAAQGLRVLAFARGECRPRRRT